jgi:hypothetical protein
MKSEFEELKEGDLVSFKLPDIDEKIYGIIRGKALVELPEIGSTYIIEPVSNNFPNETYPYSFIALPQVLTKLTKGFPKPTLPENQIIPEGGEVPSFKDLLTKLGQNVADGRLKFKTMITDSSLKDMNLTESGKRLVKLMKDDV